MRRAGARLTAEALAVAVLGGPAAVSIVGYLLGAVGLPLSPWVLAAAGALGAGLSFQLASRTHIESEAWQQRGELALFLLVLISTAAYLLWLASPSLLPVADGPDIVHHLSLIHVIQRTHHLGDPALERYLGEMVDYTPGSHILAASVAMWLGTDALRVVHPVMAVAAGVKVAFLFLVTVRVLPPDARTPYRALAAAVLVMAPSEYLLRSMLGFGFYAQVVSETFAVGMLFAIVMWTRTADRAWLVVFAFCGVAAFLAWPVWVPAAMLALALVTVSRRVPFVAGALDVTIAWGPILAVAAWHFRTHRGGTSILGTTGVVTLPSVEVFGIGFVVLVGIGTAIAVRERSARPVLVFALSVVLQAVALAALNRIAGSRSLYLPYKMVYLIVSPCAVLAALALARLSSLLPDRHATLRIASAILPLVAAVMLVRHRMPTERLRSPITESSYQAGLWARDHVPAGCIDYFSRHWLTGYWLHLDVLGNPRVSPRMREETFEFRDTAAKWIEGRGMPYAIVDDLPSLPRDVRPDVDVLARFGPAAVLQHRGSTPAACPE